jgi:hypothetical protein
MELFFNLGLLLAMFFCDVSFISYSLLYKLDYADNENRNKQLVISLLK